MTRPSLLSLTLLGVPVACSPDGTGSPTFVAPSTTADDTHSTGPPPTTALDEPTQATSVPLPDGSTTALPGTTSGADETAAEPMCGDGIVEADEECDDGFLSNQNTAACTTNCQKARCGDGFVQPAVGETCDDGAGNAEDPDYNQCAALTCTLGPHCGDSIVQTIDGEECEPDPKRGEQDTCASNCLLQTRTLFLSSVTCSGDLDGLGGADALCNALAAASPMPAGTYRAWLLGVGETLAARFPGLADPGLDYKFVNAAGAPLAGNFAELVAYGPAFAAYLDEHGDVHPEAYVWTGISAGGIAHPANCGQWTSTEGVGLVGHSGYMTVGPEAKQWHDERWWTDYAGLKYSCDKMLQHLYCLQVTE